MASSKGVFISLWLCVFLLPMTGFAADPNVISPDEFTFMALEDGANPGDQLLTITNHSSSTLSWSLVPDGGSVPSWLTVIPSGGAIASGQVAYAILQVNVTGLSAGNYNAAFQIVDNADPSAAWPATVDMEVIGPALVLSSQTFSFNGPEAGDNPNDQTLTVSNSGGGVLNWTIDTTDKPGWLTISPTSGSLSHNENEPVTLSVDITGLSGGQYNYALEISDPSAQNSPQTINVFLEVISPIIGISSNNFLFTAYLRDDPRTLMLSNPGSGTLNFSMVLAGKPDWLTVTPTSGTVEYGESLPITLSVDFTGLSDGWYTYSFEVSDPAAQNSPQTVIVKLRVGPIYVDDDAQNDPGPFDPDVSDPLENGSADHPFDSIKKGINAALVSDPNIFVDTVIVLPGIYAEKIFLNKDIVLTSQNPAEDSTVIAGGYFGYSNPIVRFGGVTSNCVLRGFTIRGNKRDQWGYGGIGVEGNGSHATITNCIIKNNNGGGLSQCNGTIANCIVKYNSVKFTGAGLYQCNGTIANCTIINNISYYAGGGLYECNGTVVDCMIIGNRAESAEYGVGYGGGLDSCNAKISNCIITDNWALSDGAGLYGCHGMITNCTIIGNIAASGYGGGISRSDSVISNCIIWGNEAGSSGDQLYSSSIPTYSCIQDWTGGGVGNISDDPLFVPDPNNGYHLKSEYGRWDPNSWVYDDATSPCIDAGDPASDWMDELWPHGGRINMGAYGGTPQASMSPNPVGNVADLDHDDSVSLIDLDLFANDWLYEKYLLDTDLNRNGMVDITDFAQFAQEWLWFEP
jgi:hypothetical protein